MLKDIFLFAGSLITYNHTFIYVFHFLLIVAIVVLLARMATNSLQLVPYGAQNIFEAYINGIISIGKDAMGSYELSRRYLPLVGTLGLVIFTANIVGMVPGFEAPTASLNLTLALTTCVFIYYHYQGFRLFGNIKGDDLFLLVMLTLAPWFVPMIPYALLTFMAILQTFIFVVLSYVYLAGAVVIDEHQD